MCLDYLKRQSCPSLGKAALSDKKSELQAVGDFHMLLDGQLDIERYFEVPRRTFSESGWDGGGGKPISCSVSCPLCPPEGSSPLLLRSGCAQVWTSVAARLPLGGWGWGEACRVQTSKDDGVAPHLPVHWARDTLETLFHGSAHSGSWHPTEAAQTLIPFLAV